MVVSVILIINAQRVWRGAPALKPEEDSSYPPGTDAVLLTDGVIAAVGATAELLPQYHALEAELQAGDEAVAVMGGRPRPPSARLIDCGGKHVVYPGFIDSHVHFLDGGRQLRSPDLSAASNRDDFERVLREHLAGGHAEGAWLYGGGWSNAVLGGDPSREWLDAVSTDIPMVLFSKDVHSSVLNTAALRLCNLLPSGSSDELVTEIEGGRIERDASGEPTGVLRDNALHHVQRFTPAADTPANQRLALEAAQAYFLRHGFTSVFSMMSTRFADNVSEVRFLTEAEREGSMRVRVRYGVPVSAMDAVVRNYHASVACDTGRTDAFRLPYRFTCTAPEAGGGYCVLGAVKLFSDGSLSSRTAAMTRPYGCDVATGGDINSDLEQAAIDAIRSAGPQCRCGLLTLPLPMLRSTVRAVHANHMQCVVHAIGDWAVASVNKALSESGEWLRAEAETEADERLADFDRCPRSRVEHFQHVANVNKEVGRMKANGIAASMQPCHLLFDGDYIDAMLGAHRKERAYIWASLLRGGVMVNLGSDWPVAPCDINDGLRGAVTRVPDVMAALAAEAQGRPVEGPRYHEVWNAAECVSVDTALRWYTTDAAYGAFMEDYVGTVEVGKFADVTVWSGDWLDESGRQPLMEGCDATWWRKGEEPQVLFTIVGGIVEYERD